MAYPIIDCPLPSIREGRNPSEVLRGLRGDGLFAGGDVHAKGVGARGEGLREGENERIFIVCSDGSTVLREPCTEIGIGIDGCNAQFIEPQFSLRL